MIRGAYHRPRPQHLGNVITSSISPKFSSTLFPQWPINRFATFCVFLVALDPGICLLFCKYYPLTLAIGQRSLEDDSVNTAQCARVADTATYGPSAEFNTILFDNHPFIVFVIHLNVGVGTLSEFEDIL